MDKPAIKVLLVDDHELVRSGVRRLLDDVAAVEVVADVGSGEAAMDIVRQACPDVVLMDVDMPGIGGMEATRRIARAMPGVRVVALMTHVDEPYPARLLEAGASGCLTKDCGLEEILAAIDTVASGGRYISADIARQMALSMLPGGKTSPIEQLSRRELQVMLMVTQGYNLQTISEKLCLSPKTVSTYRYRLYEKLGVDNDVELTRLAIRHGILPPLAST